MAGEETAIGRYAAVELGGMLLSTVRTGNPMLTLRAAHWCNAFTKLGRWAPLWAAHDLGMLAIVNPEDLVIGATPEVERASLDAPLLASLARYAEIVRELATSPVFERARALRLHDDLVAVLLLRVLLPFIESPTPLLTQRQELLPLDPQVYDGTSADRIAAFAAADRRRDTALLHGLSQQPLRLMIAVEQVDLDTLRLLGMFGQQVGAASALGMLDLLAVLESPEANDIVNFSLDLLPSVLETRRASGQQTFSIDGYSGLERRGSLDSLMLSELAHDTDLFDQRFIENEVFYYAREKHRQEDRRTHYIVIDASASMRGARAVFARGLALTLVKKVLLRGEDVFLRFFDSRLYECFFARAGRMDSGTLSVPHVLSFRGERGRHYAKVFGLLASDLERFTKRESVTPILYLITHAECHIPVETIDRLRKVARLYGIFMLPSSGQLDLEYLHRLHTVQVVDDASLSRPDARAQKALAIVDHATGERKEVAASPTIEDGGTQEGRRPSNADGISADRGRASENEQ